MQLLREGAKMKLASRQLCWPLPLQSVDLLIHMHNGQLGLGEVWQQTPELEKVGSSDQSLGSVLWMEALQGGQGRVLLFSDSGAPAAFLEELDCLHHLAKAEAQPQQGPQLPSHRVSRLALFLPQLFHVGRHISQPQ
jgi:hypothetical protein